MVAEGIADAYLEYEVHCWDFAAGDIIVREAGGISLYPTGESRSYVNLLPVYYTVCIV